MTGMRGRKPIPSALKRLAGDGIRDSGGRVIADEPATTSGAPETPEGLTTEAFAEWERICGDLASMNLLTTVDRASLELYIEQWQIKFDAWTQLRKNGTVIKLPNGYPGPNPFKKDYDNAVAFLMKWLTEYGLTASSRSRIRVSGQQDETDDDEFFETR